MFTFVPFVPSCGKSVCGNGIYVHGPSHLWLTVLPDFLSSIRGYPQHSAVIRDYPPLSGYETVPSDPRMHGELFNLSTYPPIRGHRLTPKRRVGSVKNYSYLQLPTVNYTSSF